MTMKVLITSRTGTTTMAELPPGPLILKSWPTTEVALPGDVQTITFGETVEWKAAKAAEEGEK
jgi:hypothetical protein